MVIALTEASVITKLAVLVDIFVELVDVREIKLINDASIAVNDTS